MTRGTQWSTTSSAPHFMIVMVRLVRLSLIAKNLNGVHSTALWRTCIMCYFCGHFQGLVVISVFSWLLRDPKMKLRTTYPGFTNAVNSFFNQLMKKVVPHQVLSIAIFFYYHLPKKTAITSCSWPLTIDNTGCYTHLNCSTCVLHALLNEVVFSFHSVLKKILSLGPNKCPLFIG